MKLGVRARHDYYVVFSTEINALREAFQKICNILSPQKSRLKSSQRSFKIGFLWIFCICHREDISLQIQIQILLKLFGKTYQIMIWQVNNNQGWMFPFL